MTGVPYKKMTKEELIGLLREKNAKLCSERWSKKKKRKTEREKKLERAEKASFKYRFPVFHKRMRMLEKPAFTFDF